MNTSQPLPARLLRAASRCVLPIAALFAAVTGPAAAQAIHSRFVEANGLRLHYLIAGQGDPVLLLHGYAETSHMWLPLMEALKRNHTVIAPDLRGFGESAKPASGYRKVEMADDAHALVQTLGFDRVAVVGHDIGLMVAYAYAARYRDDVRRVVLMDAFLPGIGDWQQVWLLRDKWHFNFYGETPERLVAGRERVYLEHFWNDFAADPRRSIPEHDRRFYAKAYAQPGAMHAGFEVFHAFDEDASDFRELAKTPLTVPLLAIGGGKASGPFLVAQARLIATQVEGVVVPDAGHWLMEEAPGQVTPALVRFIR